MSGDDRKVDLAHAYKHLIDNISVDELNTMLPTSFAMDSDWTQWVEEIVPTLLEEPEHKILHGKIRQYIRDNSNRTVRRS